MKTAINTTAQVSQLSISITNAKISRATPAVSVTQGIRAP